MTANGGIFSTWKSTGAMNAGIIAPTVTRTGNTETNGGDGPASARIDNAAIAPAVR